MKTIWKYSRELHTLQDVIYFDMPADAVVLSVGNQNETLCLWAEVWQDRTGKLVKKRGFRIAGTGHPLDEGEFKRGRFIGTVQFENGRLVLHVYEEAGQ